MSKIARTCSIAATSALLILTAACGASNSSAGSTSGKTIASAPKSKAASNTLNWFGNAGDADWVKTLDPCCVTDSVSIGDIDMVNANLVKADYPSLKIIPDLATWTTSPDHQVYTFHMRANAKFSNGDPVTAQDAAWSITRSLLPATKSPVASTYLGHIQGALAVAGGKAKKVSGLKVVNKHTLQITLDKPVAYFLGALSYPTADVLDKKVLQGKAPQAYLSNTCKGNVGAGPFIFVCRNKSSNKSSFYPNGHTPYMKFVPNPKYYGKEPHVTVIDPFIADTQTNYKDYLAGAVDGTAVPTADLSAAQKKQGFVKVPQLETDYITPNATIAPFNNIHCRLAVSYAIDRVGITTKLLHGTEGPLYDVVPPSLLGYFGKESDVPSYNPTRAKQELAKCPGHLSNAILTYQNTSTDLSHEYDAIKANVQAIGGNLTLKPLTFNAWLNVVGQSMNATKNQENITENLWIDDYPDTQDWVDNLLHSGANYDIGGFSNKQYDKLVDEGNTTFNDAERAKYYKQAMKIAVKTGAWIGVGYVYGVYLVNPRVHGMIASSGGSFSGINPKHNDWSNVSVSG